MKKLFFTIILLPSMLFADGFIHPLEFDPETDKEEVIKYIESDTLKRYSEIGMDNPSTLRMMEKEELKAFKELTNSENEVLLNDVIQRYCEIGMCNYGTINMMYKKEIKASSESLEW